MGRIICLGLLLAFMGALWLAPKKLQRDASPQKPTAQAASPEQMTRSVSLPYAMPQWGIAVEALICYDGPYIEDGTSDPVENVAGLVLRNTGETGLLLAVLAVEQGSKTTYFSATWLPPGEAVLALAMERSAYSSNPITAVRVLGIRRQDFVSAPVQVDEWEDGLVITNRSDESLMGIRLRHKIYWQDRGIYFGGVTQSIWVPLLQPGESYLLYPENYDREKSKIVGIIK